MSAQAKKPNIVLIVSDDTGYGDLGAYGGGEGRAQRLTFTTNVGDETVAGPDNPIRVETDPRSGEPAPYVHVRKGIEARIAREGWPCRLASLRLRLTPEFAVDIEA